MLSFKYPVARKAHTCLLCRRMIQPGEKYERQTAFDGSAPRTYIGCQHCTAMRDVFTIENWDDLILSFEDIVDFEPRTDAGQDAKRHWWMQWADKNGNLVEVPS